MVQERVIIMEDKMAFITNASQIAEEAMELIQPSLANTYSQLISFLASEPDAASNLKGRNAPSVGSEEYIRRQATSFANSRSPRSPKPPETIPDEMVSIILREYFDVPEESLVRAKQEHLLSMGAENLVGELLERYLASHMEPRGWIWCSGSIVKAVDFVKPPRTAGTPWILLQVKNRDNSENSSSSAIRTGTTIQKWHRTFSKRTGTNWGEFPDDSIKTLVSEENFKTFVSDYLRSLKALEQ